MSEYNRAEIICDEIDSHKAMADVEVDVCTVPCHTSLAAEDISEGT